MFSQIELVNPPCRASLIGYNGTNWFCLKSKCQQRLTILLWEGSL